MGAEDRVHKYSPELSLTVDGENLIATLMPLIILLNTTNEDFG
jgi:hypothetical protein